MAKRKKVAALKLQASQSPDASYHLYKKWLISYPKCAAWAKQYDLPSMVEENGGLVIIKNFLPVRDECLRSTT